MSQISKYKAVCPECEFEFNVDEPEVGEIITCSDCSLNLQVITIDSSKTIVDLELTETEADDWGE